MAGLIASQVGLLTILVGLWVAVLSLARQIGVLHERTAPAAGLLQRLRQADRIDLDAIQVTTLAGVAGPLRRFADSSFALLFVSEECLVCKSLLPQYEALLQPAGVTPFVVSNAVSLRSFSNFAATHGLCRRYCLVSPQLAAALQVLQTPTLVVMDADGRVAERVRLKGPRHLARLMSRHLDSLNSA